MIVSTSKQGTRLATRTGFVLIWLILTWADVHGPASFTRLPVHLLLLLTRHTSSHRRPCPVSCVPVSPYSSAILAVGRCMPVVKAKESSLTPLSSLPFFYPSSPAFDFPMFHSWAPHEEKKNVPCGYSSSRAPKTLS